MDMGLIMGIVITGVVLLSVIPTIFFAVKLIGGLHKNKQQEQRLLASGVPAKAQIMSVQQTGTYVNNQPQAHIVLTVYPQGSGPYQAQLTKIVSLFEVSHYQVGAHVDVRYDPANPTQVAIVPAGASMGMAPMAAPPQPHAQGYGPPPGGYPPQGGAPPGGTQ